MRKFFPFSDNIIKHVDVIPCHAFPGSSRIVGCSRADNEIRKGIWVHSFRAAVDLRAYFCVGHSALYNEVTRYRWAPVVVTPASSSSSWSSSRWPPQSGSLLLPLLLQRNVWSFWTGRDTGDKVLPVPLFELSPATTNTNRLQGGCCSEQCCGLPVSGKKRTLISLPPKLSVWKNLSAIVQRWSCAVGFVCLKIEFIFIKYLSLDASVSLKIN